MKTIYTFLFLIFSGVILAPTSPAAIRGDSLNIPGYDVITNAHGQVIRTDKRPSSIAPLTNAFSRIPPLTNAPLTNTLSPGPLSTNTLSTNTFSTNVPLANPTPPAFRNVPIRGRTNNPATNAATPIPSETLPPPALPSTPPLTNTVAFDTNKTDIIPLIHFDNAPLVQVLDFYSDLVGRTILRGPSLPITTMITLVAKTPLTKGESIQALETAMAMNGITVVPIGTKFAKVVAEATAREAGAPFSNLTADELPESGKYVTQIVQLQNIPAQEAITAIQNFAKTPASIIPIASSQTLVLRDYSENVKRMMEVIKKIDVVTPLEFKSELIAIKYALAVDIASVLGQLTASGPGTAVGKSPRTGGLSNPVSYQQGQNQGIPGQQQQPTQSPYGTGATGNRSNFQNQLQRIVQKASQAGEFQILGEAKIIPDERTNSLLIFANDADMKMIKSIIAKMDVVLAQVLIEAIIMEVSLDNGRNFGVSYLQHPNHGFNAGGGVNNGQPFISPIG
ncbi:MAG: hypothetical protein M3Y82_13270, partial [Verrucomicrobiota bacterium]|nr:hypothetical protein [Verrucomicrobiota bacterium]